MSRLSATLLIVACLWSADPLTAEIKVDSIYPSGGKRGERIEVQVSGKGSDKAVGLFFSQRGLAAERIAPGRFRITIASDAPRGECDVWAVAPDEMSGPRRFQVTDLAGILEKENNNRREAAQRVELSAIVDARLDRTADVDWFRFEGKQGQFFSAICRSDSLDGSMIGAIRLLGPDGRELAHEAGHRREAAVHLRLPSDGSYWIRVTDRAYRKDDHSYYRLWLVVKPRVMGVFPSIMPYGRSAPLRVLGHALPKARAEIAGKDWKVVPRVATVTGPIQFDDLRRGGLPANALMFATATQSWKSLSGTVRIVTTADPIVLEKNGSNSLRKEAQDVTLPCRISGRFLERGDLDWYRVRMRKGQRLMVDAFGERLGQVMDLDVAVYDGQGRSLVVFPDFDSAKKKKSPAGLPMTSLDVSADWRAPRDGDFYLAIRDLYGGSVFGPERQYHLALAVGKAAFRVVATGAKGKARSAFSVRRGESVTIPLSVLRRGPATGIRVLANALPAGVRASKCVVGSKKATGTLRLEVGKQARLGVFALRLSAHGIAATGKKKAVSESDKPGSPASVVAAIAEPRAGRIRQADAVVLQIRDGPSGK